MTAFFADMKPEHKRLIALLVVALLLAAFLVLRPIPERAYESMRTNTGEHFLGNANNESLREGIKRTAYAHDIQFASVSTDSEGAVKAEGLASSHDDALRFIHASGPWQTIEMQVNEHDSRFIEITLKRRADH